MICVYVFSFFLILYAYVDRSCDSVECALNVIVDNLNVFLMSFKIINSLHHNLILTRAVCLAMLVKIKERSEEVECTNL